NTAAGIEDLANSTGAVDAFVASPPSGFTKTLTTGQDFFNGQGHDTVFAPLTAPPGSPGSHPTLTDGDQLIDTAIGKSFGPVIGTFFANTLNATFDGDHDANQISIINFQTWNVNQDGNGTVVLDNGVGNVIRGLNTLNYNGNGGNSSLEISDKQFPVR